MVNNVIFTDLKRQEALEKADEETSRHLQPVMKYTRSKSFSYRRRSSVGLRQHSIARRKSIDPLCVNVRSFIFYYYLFLFLLFIIIIFYFYYYINIYAF